MQRAYALVIALALVWCAGALRHPPAVLAAPPGPPHDRLTRLETALDSLGLDEGRRTTIQGALDTARVEQETLRTQLKQAHGDLRALLAQDAPDETAVLAQAEVIGHLETTSRQQLLRTLLTVRGLLTPEQRVKLRAVMQPPGDGPPH